MTEGHERDAVAVDEVEVDDEFWSPWIRRNREVTVEHQYEQLEESGTLENFRRVADGDDDPAAFSGMWFQDSDAYKWLEAASYVLASRDDPELRGKVDEVIDLVAAAQEGSGYVNTYFQLVEPDRRWTNLHMMHELYCIGHLIEAGVAHHEATGDDRLLDVARRAADHVDDVFPEEVDGVPGHEEIELALIRLSRTTGEERYLDLARYFVDLRGHDDRLAWEVANPEAVAGGPDVGGWGWSLEDSGGIFRDDDGEYDGRYAQAHAPLREQDTVEGHAVRAMYLFAAATDLVAEGGDDDLRAALSELWENMTARRMYVTGGIGPEHAHEGFTEDYDLRNEAYAETCAAVGSIFWNQRLFELEGEGRYHDVVERTLYNGFLAGVSLDGTRFFYENPLTSSGDHHRTGWFTCACCPPNAARLLASLGRYLYATGDGAVYVNQYVGSTLETTLDDAPVELEQSSSLPWAGEATVDVRDAPDDGVTLRLRVPAWAEEFVVDVDGEPVDHDGSGYVEVTVGAGDSVSVTAPLEVEPVRAHPAVECDAGRVAVTRGPLVYCAEQADNERPTHQYALPEDASFEETHRENLLDGVTTLTAEATVPSLEGWDGTLYRPADETDREADEIAMIPYYAWDNREPGSMDVWIRSP